MRCHVTCILVLDFDSVGINLTPYPYLPLSVCGEIFVKTLTNSKSITLEVNAEIQDKDG